MPPATNATKIASTSAAPTTIDADLVVLPWYEDDLLETVPGLDAGTGGEVSRAIATREFQAKPYEMFVTPLDSRGWRARRVALVGGGRRADCDSGLLRRLAAAAGISARLK